MATRQGSRWLVLAALASAGAGAWLSGELLKQQADIWNTAKAPGLLDRICGAIGQGVFDCDGAARSRWAEIVVTVPVPSTDLTVLTRRVRVPVAFVGLAYFVSIGVWFAVVGRPRPENRRWHRVPRAASLCALAVSLFYMAVMSLGLASWCLGCVAVHLANAVLVSCVWALRCGPQATASGAGSDREATPREHAGNRTSGGRRALTATAFASVLVTGLWLYLQDHLAMAGQVHKLLGYQAMIQSLRNDPEFVLREHLAQPRHAIRPRPGENVAPGRPQLVIFTDFQCPACYHESVSVRNEVAEAFAGQLAVLVRHYPLCGTCNDQVAGELHPHACLAAGVAEAAHMQGGPEAFWRMHDRLFANQTKLGPELYRALAAEIGLDAERLLRDAQSETVRQTIASDIQLARELGVTGTPTMFLDGRRVTELCRGPVFWDTMAKARTSQDPEGTATALRHGGRIAEEPDPQYRPPAP